MKLRAVVRLSNAAGWIALLVLSVSISEANAQQPGSKSDRLPPWNDNSLIEIQKKGGDPGRPGNVKIEFYGHDAFKIATPGGLTILTDPWRNDSTGQYPKWFLNDFPALQVDIVLSTHAHFDHDAVNRPKSLVVLERLVGHWKLGDAEITGLADKHKCDPTPDDGSDQASLQVCPPNNDISLDNAIQVIRTGGLRIAVWGDNRGLPDSSLDQYLKDIDVLILPVDNVLTRPEVNAIVKKYDPKAVIPAHYFLEGLNTTTSGLESVDSWVNDEEKNHHADARRLGSAELTLNPADLKGSHSRIYYFGNHFAKK